MIERELHGSLYKDCLAYIDDVVVFSVMKVNISANWLNYLHS